MSTTLYAAPGATGDGLTLATPGSIATVQALAPAASASGDVTIDLRGGTYPIAAPLQFTSADSGRNGHKIYWQAHAGEVPIISGGILVTGWTQYDANKNIWRASVPAGTVSRQFYVNDQRATRAQRAITQGLVTGRLNDSKTYDCSDATMPTFARPGDLEFVYTGLPHAWVQERLGIGSTTSTGGHTATFVVAPLAEQAWSAYTYDPDGGSSPLPRYPSVIENAYEFLSASTPGQWYLDSSAGTISYVPRAGEDMATVDARLPVSEGLVVAAGASDVEFVGITFAHSGWTRPTEQQSFIDVQANYYCDLIDPTVSLPPAAVDIAASKRIRVKGCTFKHLGAQGLALHAGTRDSVVEGSEFTDTSSAPLRIGEYSYGSIPPADKQTGGIVVRGNHVHDAVVEYSGGVGIQVGYVDHVQVLHNEIDHLPYTGVSWGWGWDSPGYTDSYVNSNEFGWNSVHDVMQMLGDGGAFYTLGVQGVAGRFQVHDNYVFRTKGSGFYPDQGSRYLDYYSNVVAEAGFGAWFGANITLTDSATLASWNNYSNTNNGNPPTAATLIAGTVPAGWPFAAQAIVAQAGVVPAFSLDPTWVVSGGAVTLTGARAAGTTVTLSAPGATLGAVSYPDATSWSCTVSAIIGQVTITATSDGETASVVVTGGAGPHTLRAEAGSAPYLVTIDPGADAPPAAAVAGAGPVALRASLGLAVSAGTSGAGAIALRATLSVPAGGGTSASPGMRLSGVAGMPAGAGTGAGGSIGIAAGQVGHRLRAVANGPPAYVDLVPGVDLLTASSLAGAGAVAIGAQLPAPYAGGSAGAGTIVIFAGIGLALPAATGTAGAGAVALLGRLGMPAAGALGAGAPIGLFRSESLALPAGGAMGSAGEVAFSAMAPVPAATGRAGAGSIALSGGSLPDTDEALTARRLPLSITARPLGIVLTAKRLPITIRGRT